MKNADYSLGVIMYFTTLTPPTNSIKKFILNVRLLRVTVQKIEIEALAAVLPPALLFSKVAAFLQI